jgi:methylmalonyl-CoA mutase C-terminal domain/subunit
MSFGMNLENTVKTQPSSKPDTGRSPVRILIAKPGLDGHDRGAKYIARALSEAGYEVLYTGIRQTPDQIVNAAIQEDVQLVGLSTLSGAHNSLFPKVVQLLTERGAGDIIVFGGGVIPAEDIPGLKDAGIAEVFTPGTPIRTVIEFVQKVAG